MAATGRKREQTSVKKMLPPPPPKNKKMMSAHIHMLDDTVTTFTVQFKCLGQSLFDQVCQMLNLLEVDYFGIEYTDSKGLKIWLDYEKPMCRQVGLSLANPVLYFCVKFYMPDPAQLEEEYTRYLFSLQIKRDLAQGILQCNDNTAAIMASYIVQAECGDYASEDYPDHTYLSSFKFVPHQDAELERKIMENHKKHLSQVPSEADLNLLETSRRCELYGVRMTPAKDCEGVPLSLSVAHLGVLVFQGTSKINTFSWAKIRKLSFKRKRFLIKLHSDTFGYFKDTVEFVFENRNECKNFWKKCLENHAFFRCTDVKSREPRPKSKLFSRGSSFRYSGRTQKQMIEYVRENFLKREPFNRSNSLRGYSRGGVGTSISAQPLVPVGESQSCGSMVLDPEVPSPVKQFSVSQPSSPRMFNGRHSRDLPPAFESPPPYPCKETMSPGSHGKTSLQLSDAGSLRNISSDEDVSRSPSSPLRSVKDDRSSIYSDRTSADLRSRVSQIETAFYVAKELLMTERTYKKDLELVNVWLRDEMSREEDMPTDVLSVLFAIFDPLYEFHCSLLRDLELRINQCSIIII